MIADHYPEVDYELKKYFNRQAFDIAPPLASTDELQVNVSLEPTYELSIWGQFKTPQDLPLYHYLVLLVGFQYDDLKPCYLGETYTSPNGFYLMRTKQIRLSCYAVVLVDPKGTKSRILYLPLHHCPSCPRHGTACTHALLQSLHALGYTFFDTTCMETLCFDPFSKQR